MQFNFINDKNYKKGNTILIVPTSIENLSSLNNHPLLSAIKLAEVTSLFEFKAKEKQVLDLKTLDGFKRIILVGLGSQEKITDKSLLNIGGLIADLSKKEESIDILLQNGLQSCLYEHILLGIKLKSWGFDKYISNKEAHNTYKIKEINILGISDFDTTNIDAIADGVCTSKCLVNEPANILYPATYAQKIKELEKIGVTVEVLNKTQLEHIGMGSLLSVAQGSSREPYVVILKYMQAEDKSEQPLAFVGKGVTFDSGGYSLKPASGMMDMKKDMAGSAAVVGLMKTLAKRRAKVNVIGIVGLVENMVNGSATKPGDIVKAMNGKTIEVLNTDAEGRLVLADLLYYTSTEFKPKIMVNLATLTGAIIVSLGGERAGLFSNNQDLTNKLLKSGEETGELLWNMPMGEEYAKHLKSNICDLQNISTSPRVAGSIFGAMFLKEFVNDTPWAHLDIAGVADVASQTDIHKKGATGFGVRLLNNFIKTNYEK
jgi:leucyl aminopeptidase